MFFGAWYVSWFLYLLPVWSWASHSSFLWLSFLICFRCSVTQLYPTLCNLMDCSMPGFPVFYHLPELARTHVHWVDDAIQPSPPLSPPSPPAFNLSQHQGLFQWVSSSHQMAKVLELQLQQQSSNEYSGLVSFRTDCVDDLVIQEILKSLLQHHSLKASIC